MLREDLASSSSFFDEVAEEFHQRALSSQLMSSRCRGRTSSEMGDSAFAAEEQMEEFKQQIQEKFIISVANKIYSFPFTMDAYESLAEDYRQFQNLKGEITEYNINNPIEDCQPHKGMLKEKSNDGKRMLNLIETLKFERKRLQNGTNNFISRERESRAERGTDVSKNRYLGEDKLKKSISEANQNNSKFIYGTINRDDNERLSKRMRTEPHQKLQEKHRLQPSYKK